MFCEDLEMQAFLAMAIQERFSLERRPMCISGKVAGHKRQDMVTAFQSSPAAFDVLILSPKAGGVGLTITAANNVIHLSRWWNPAVEDQATDRAYRIGQTRPVTIHIPMAVHPDEAIGPSSFDQRLDALMERKRSLSRGLLMPPESERDVEDLLSDVLDGRRRDDTQSETETASDKTAPDDEAHRYSASAPEPQKSEPEARGPEEAQVQEEEKRQEFVELAGGDQPGAADKEALAESSADASIENPPGSGIQTSPEIDVSDTSGQETRRPILSARTPVEAAEARVPSVQRVVFEQYGQRDWTIFEQYARDAKIAKLEIQDPYCCADEQARGRLLNFIGRFAQLASELAAVQIVTFDADSVQTRAPESTHDQRQDLEDRWNRMLSPVPLHLAQKSRRSGGDLHDRYVKARLDNGDCVIWDLGRGIDGVMSARWSCVVNAFYEGSSPNSRAMH